MNSGLNGLLLQRCEKSTPAIAHGGSWKALEFASVVLAFIHCWGVPQPQLCAAGEQHCCSIRKE